MVHVLVVGCGNIGSHLIPLLGRMEEIDRITLVDKDRYTDENHVNQAIRAGDSGVAKVKVQARVLRQLKRRLTVRTLTARIEDLPVGWLRCDLLLTCLDNGLGRQYVNQMVWRLGIPAWIDAGVEPEGLLARVTFLQPGEGLACFECSWDEARYKSLEWSFPCGVDGIESTASKPSAGLGALVASVQALECWKFLTGQPGSTVPGRQIVIGAMWQRFYSTQLQRSPACRFDHATWDLREIAADPSEMTLRDALALGGGHASGLRVEGSPFVHTLSCLGCSRRWEPVKLRASLKPADRRCPSCGTEARESGWDLVDCLEPERFPAAAGNSLRALGVRRGDVLCLSTGHSQVRYLLSGGGRS